MRVQVFSIHKLYDNRISRHLSTLVKNNITTEYVNISLSKKNDFELVNVVSLKHINHDFNKKHPIRVLYYITKMKKYIREFCPEIVHIHDPLLLPITRYINKKECKIVFDKHESFEKISGLNGQISKILEKMYRKKIDAVIFVNSSQQEYLLKLNYTTIAMIPNYQSKSIFSLNNKNNYNNINIIYIGSLSEKTREISLMLSIIEKVLAKYQHVHFKLGGMVEDAFTQETINRLSATYPKSFKYLGVIKYSEVVSHTIESDIGLYFAKNTPNNQFSSPNKIYEYMISGLAIIGIGNFTNSKEITGKCGKVFDFEFDIDSITNYFYELIDNPNMLNEMKRNSLLMGESYTWESVENRYIDIYNHITNYDIAKKKKE